MFNDDIRVACVVRITPSRHINNKISPRFVTPSRVRDSRVGPDLGRRIAMPSSVKPPPARFKTFHFSVSSRVYRVYSRGQK